MQNDPSLEYIAEVSWQTSLEKRKEETQKVRYAVIAFADDTT